MFIKITKAIIDLLCSVQHLKNLSEIPHKFKTIFRILYIQYNVYCVGDNTWPFLITYGTMRGTGGIMGRAIVPRYVSPVANAAFLYRVV